MRHSVRDAILSIAAISWMVALLIKWFGPDDGPIDTIGLVFGVIGVAALAVWLGGRIVARIRRDPTARIDARVIFALGAIAAVFAGALIASLTGSDPAGYVIIGTGVAGAFYASTRFEHRGRDGV